MQSRIVEVRQGILKKNDLLAHGLRQRFEAANLFAVNLVSSPGAGKTTFLQATLTALHAHCRVAALVGDLATERDAERLARSGAPVRQIVTGTVCHLEAEMVGSALADWDLAVLTKMDIAEAVGFDREEALRNIQEVRPGLEVLETSARSGLGMGAWLAKLKDLKDTRDLKD